MTFNLTPYKSIPFTMLLFFVSQSWAQNGEDIDDEKPASETEIICYAAKNKWVCAPADDKQRAHEKAMKLAAQPDERDAGIEIQTMDVSNDFSQQVQENTQSQPDPNSLEAAIRDFIPREDASQPSEDTQTVVAQNSEPVTQQPASQEPTIQEPVTPEPITPEPVTRQSTVSNSTPVQNQSVVGTTAVSDNDFSVWQNNYPEQWSFQVVGTSNRHHIDQFIVSQGINKGPYAVVKTQVNNADWWVVLSGLYDSREQALSQRHTLPIELSGNAWVRQIKTIVGRAD